jgi:hypothetical protein
LKSAKECNSNTQDVYKDKVPLKAKRRTKLQEREREREREVRNPRNIKSPYQLKRELTKMFLTSSSNFLRSSKYLPFHSPHMVHIKHNGAILHTARTK